MLACAAAAMPAAAEGAGGGASIAAAPDAPLGVTLNGNTSSDDVANVPASLGPGASCPGDGEFWVLSLTQGDELRVEGTGLAPAAQIWLDLFEPGTTDQTLGSAAPVLSKPLGDASVTVARSGKYPVLIGTSAGCGGVDGPFHFAALVVHQAVVSLPALSSLRRAGTVTAHVGSPDRRPITDPRLVLTLRASYRAAGATRRVVLGRAAATGGAAAFQYRLPASAGGRVTLTLTAHGAAYRPVRPATRTVPLR